MAKDLAAGFSNNVNVVQTRTSGTSMQRATDRVVDTDGDGADQKVTITHVSGHAAGTASAPGGKVRSTISGGIIHDPAGTARSVLSRDQDADGGVNTAGEEFTNGTA